LHASWFGEAVFSRGCQQHFSTGWIGSFATGLFALKDSPEQNEQKDDIIIDDLVFVSTEPTTMAFNPLTLLNTSNHAYLFVELARFPAPYGWSQSIGPFEMQGWELEGPDRDGNSAVMKGYNISLHLGSDVVGNNPPVAWFLGQNRILFKLPESPDGQWFEYYLFKFTDRTMLLPDLTTPESAVDENNGNIERMTFTVNDSHKHYSWVVRVHNDAETYVHV